MNKILVGVLLMFCVGIVKAEEIMIPVVIKTNAHGIPRTEIKVLCIEGYKYIIARSREGGLAITQMTQNVKVMTATELPQNITCVE